MKRKKNKNFSRSLFSPLLLLFSVLLFLLLEVYTQKRGGDMKATFRRNAELQIQK
jgi:hypothetical protein